MLSDVEFKEAHEIAKVNKLKIVACDGKSMLFYSQYVNRFILYIYYHLPHLCHKEKKH